MKLGGGDCVAVDRLALLKAARVLDRPSIGSQRLHVAALRDLLRAADSGPRIIYPNQFYDWKKKLLDGGAAPASAGRKGRPASNGSGLGLTGEARLYIEDKTALLERLRKQRSELDGLIAQMQD